MKSPHPTAIITSCGRMVVLLSILALPDSRILVNPSKYNLNCYSSSVADNVIAAAKANGIRLIVAL